MWPASSKTKTSFAPLDLGFVDVAEVAGAGSEACGFCAAAPVLDALAAVLLECAPEPAPGLPDVLAPLPDALAPAAEFAGLVDLSEGFVLAADSAGFGDVVLCD